MFVNAFEDAPTIDNIRRNHLGGVSLETQVLAIGRPFRVFPRAAVVRVLREALENSLRRALRTVTRYAENPSTRQVMSTRRATLRASGRFWTGTLIVLLLSALTAPADALDVERIRGSLEALLRQGGRQARSQDPPTYRRSLQRRAQDAAFDRATLAALYEHRTYQPLWTVNGRLSPKVTAVLHSLWAAGDYGLPASDYQGEPLTEEFAPGEAYAGSIATTPSDGNSNMSAR